MFLTKLSSAGGLCKSVSMCTSYLFQTIAIRLPLTLAFQFYYLLVKVSWNLYTILSFPQQLISPVCML